MPSIVAESGFGLECFSLVDVALADEIGDLDPETHFVQPCFFSNPVRFFSLIDVLRSCLLVLTFPHKDFLLKVAFSVVLAIPVRFWWIFF